ncbi:MAG: hypothetical protein MUO63_16665 [Desulfobulbaceae bacterium]|nr:hypothetical protein [Desulfobulbaceae bacterium]
MVESVLNPAYDQILKGFAPVVRAQNKDVVSGAGLCCRRGGKHGVEGHEKG